MQHRRTPQIDILGTQTGQQRSGKVITFSPGTHVVGAQLATCKNTIDIAI